MFSSDSPVNVEVAVRDRNSRSDFRWNKVDFCNPMYETMFDSELFRVDSTTMNGDLASSLDSDRGENESSKLIV